jgi:hypothetical protein
MKKIIIILFICYLVPFVTTAQDTLKGTYRTLHLSAKSYYVSEVVTVSDSLIVDAGARLKLVRGVSIICFGAVAINGTADNRVYVQNASAQNAQGFVFAGYSPTNIRVSYTRFEQMVLPLNFEHGWYRLSADVNHNEFIKSSGSIAVVQVSNPVSSLDDRKIPVAFTLAGNLFAENSAPLYFEDLAGDVMQVKINANAFVNNTTRDYGKYTFSSNFLFGRADNTQSKYFAEITQNSFAFNTLWNGTGDSVLHEANMGVYGSMDSLKIQGNYWGQGNEAMLRRGIYDYTVDYTSPRLVITPFLQAPASNLPTHIYKIMRMPISGTQKASYRYPNNQWKTTIDSIGTIIGDNFDLRTGLQSLELSLNNAPVSNNVTVHFIHLKDSMAIADTIVSNKVNNVGAANAVVFDFAYTADSLFRARPGYLLVSGLTGGQGEYIADVKIGYGSFLRAFNQRKLEYELKSKKKDSSGSIVKPPVPVVTNTRFKNKYEIGVMGAYAIYYGTLSNKALFKNDYNSFLGVQVRYSLKSHVSLSLSAMKMNLTGSDLNSGDSSKIKRGLSFKTPVTNFSFQVEYDFADNSVYSSKNRIRPSIGFGVDYMTFKPTADYLGTTYDLQAIGTGGQRLAGSANGPYSLSSFGAPITTQVRYYLNKKTIFSLFASYHLAFTDYLDDVGPDAYPDPAKLAAANAGNSDAAVYLSNPTKRLVGASQLRSGLASGSDSFFTFGFTLAHHF